MDTPPELKRIGIITSGGDAPGMNAAVRASVRAALALGAEVVGFTHGYKGIIENEVIELNSKSVGGIISQGGTMLRTARSAEFRTDSGRRKAHEVLLENGVQGLIVIGGDGSLAGARRLQKEFSFPVMGIPASIDNDIAGTDSSIGFDTAVNTAVDAIDKIRDTAYSHERVFVIEVMGRDNGFIAVDVALSCGAEACMIPERPTKIAEVCRSLESMREKGKRSSIVVVAEGAVGNVNIKAEIEEQTGFEARYTILGHMQRGGRPTAFDRILALRLGALAAKRIVSGESSEMVGVEGGKLVSHPLSYVLSTERSIESEKLKLVDIMAQ